MSIEFNNLDKIYGIVLDYGLLLEVPEAAALAIPLQTADTIILFASLWQGLFASTEAEVSTEN
jgi:hypothetical protein